jgi:hypothetical protein
MHTLQCPAEQGAASVQLKLALGARPVRRARHAHAERGAARGAQELASRGDLDAFVNGARDERVLTVVAVTATSVGACVRVFPAVVALAKSFAGYATFGRLLYDAGPETAELAAELNVKQVRCQHATVRRCRRVCAGNVACTQNPWQALPRADEPGCCPTVSLCIAMPPGHCWRRTRCAPAWHA